MVRTLVAVGTVRLASMFVARAFAMPLSGVTVSSVGASWSSAATGTDAVEGAWAGIGCGCGAIEVVRAMGWLPVMGTEAAGTEAGAAVGVEAGTGTSGIVTVVVGAGCESVVADWW